MGLDNVALCGCAGYYSIRQGLQLLWVWRVVGERLEWQRMLLSSVTMAAPSGLLLSYAFF
jgi:hypothetical protein